MKNPIHKEMIEEFHSWYEAEKGIKFIWDAKQTKQIDMIYDKLNKACTKNGNAFDHRTIAMLFKKILENLSKVDKWVYDNVSPALISSKFNEITAKIKANREGKGKYTSMKVDLINEMFGK